MVEETARLARGFSGQGWPILAFLDTHVPGKPEPPYPPHCEAGTGEEDLVPELTWLGDDPHATLVRKDCINGFVGAIRPDGSNAVVDWVNANKLQRLVVVGIRSEEHTSELQSLMRISYAVFCSTQQTHNHKKYT